MDDSSEEARDQFYISRAEALNSYALLERALTILFAAQLGTAPNYATLIVSKIINTRARNEVIQKVVDHSTGKRFRPFTNSLFAQVAEADGLRNQLVHWHVEERDDGTFALCPTDILSTSDARMTEAEIDALNHHCLFLSGVTLVFSNHTRDWAKDPALHERFRLPLRYPPEPDDPLFRCDIIGSIRPLSLQP